jgi:hypothetical protein
MTRAGIKIPALARHLNVSYQAVKKVLDGASNAFTASNNERASTFLGVSSRWLSTGEGPMIDPSLAHDMSQARPTLTIQKVEWERLMSADLSRPFELEVIDDALMPELFRGCIAMLDPERPPDPGWPVLVRDAAGRFYLRDYEDGPGGRFRAVARVRGFGALDSVEHGLTIVAAMEGYRRPRRTT